MQECDLHSMGMSEADKQEMKSVTGGQRCFLASGTVTSLAVQEMFWFPQIT